MCVVAFRGQTGHHVASMKRRGAIQSDVGISPTLNKTHHWERGRPALDTRGQDALAPRLLANIPHHFESHPMQAFLQEVGSALAADAPGLSVEALERQMNLVGGSTESPRPKNVGLLFFNKTPERFFPGVQIDVVWFPEGAGGDRFEEKIFKGPLARMMREALSYIQRN